MQYLSM